MGLERLVDDDKADDYIGREALLRIRATGVTRRLVGIEIAGEPVDFNMTKWPVTKDGTPIGHVTSAVYSPRLKKNIGYAMVPAACASLGSALTVAIPGMGGRTATVVPKPLIDPDKRIPKGR